MGAGEDVEFGGDAGAQQPVGVGNVLVEEEVQGADGDEAKSACAGRVSSARKWALRA